MWHYLGQIGLVMLGVLIGLGIAALLGKAHEGEREEELDDAYQRGVEDERRGFRVVGE